MGRGWLRVGGGANPCSSWVHIPTHQSFLHCTLAQLYILMDRNGTAYNRTSNVQHNYYVYIQLVSFKRLRHSLYTRTLINIYGAFPLLFISPCWFPFVPLCSPLNPLLLTWNPPSCDRIRPPRSQVACKLTSPVPTLSPNPTPSKFPEPQLPSASLRRPQVESGIFCPEQGQNLHFLSNCRYVLWFYRRSKSNLENFVKIRFRTLL